MMRFFDSEIDVNEDVDEDDIDEDDIDFITSIGIMSLLICFAHNF